MPRMDFCQLCVSWLRFGTRLLEKNNRFAIQFVKRWGSSNYRLVRRLGSFRLPINPCPFFWRQTLSSFSPSGELFLTNSAVEVFRLLRARAAEFPVSKWKKIQKRIMDGPPRHSFREGAHIDRVVDRCRFDLLGRIVRSGIQISAEAQQLLNEINWRWPGWRMRPIEQAGFHVGTGVNVFSGRH